MVGTPDVITHENFGDDRIRDLGVAGGQILPFPIDFDRRPYNTLALPCECVISHAVVVMDTVVYNGLLYSRLQYKMGFTAENGYKTQ